jgi:hypothetical protein
MGLNPSGKKQDQPFQFSFDSRLMLVFSVTNQIRTRLAAGLGVGREARTGLVQLCEPEG